MLILFTSQKFGNTFFDLSCFWCSSLHLLPLRIDTKCLHFLESGRGSPAPRSGPQIVPDCSPVVLGHSGATRESISGPMLHLGSWDRQGELLYTAE